MTPLNDIAPEKGLGGADAQPAGVLRTEPASGLIAPRAHQAQGDTPGKVVADLVSSRLAINGRSALEVSNAKTPIPVVFGPWSGFVVRRARRFFKCDGRCGHTVSGGHLYLEGEIDPYKAGGFAHDRLCLQCAGPMVLHAVAAAIAECGK